MLGLNFAIIKCPKLSLEVDLVLKKRAEERNSYFDASTLEARNSSRIYFKHKIYQLTNRSTGRQIFRGGGHTIDLGFVELLNEMSAEA